MGLWDIYCPLCGNPCSSQVEVALITHRWMNHCRVISTSKYGNKFSDVGIYNMVGDLNINGASQGYAFDQNPAKENEDDRKSPTITMVHDSCWIVCNYPAVFTSTASNDLKRWHGQFFEGFENAESWMLLDPLIDITNRQRIISKITVKKYFPREEPVPTIGTKKFVIVAYNKITKQDLDISGNDTIAMLKARVRGMIRSGIGKMSLYLNSTTALAVDYQYDLYTLSKNWNQIDVGYVVIESFQ